MASARHRELKPTGEIRYADVAEITPPIFPF